VGVGGLLVCLTQCQPATLNQQAGIGGVDAEIDRYCRDLFTG
jgi:hypothetical protein